MLRPIFPKGSAADRIVFQERARVLDQIAADHTFAFAKYDNAFSNLLATVKRATPVTSSRPDVCIIPSGLPDIERFSKGERTKFFLSGTSIDQREPISFDLDQTFVDTPSGMKVSFCSLPPRQVARAGAVADPG